MDGAITKYIDVVFDGDYKQVAPSVHRYDHGIAIRIRGVPTNVVWQCHFSCRGNETSIPSIAVKEGNAVVGVIPDIILMQPREVICYLYYEDNNFGRTVYEIFIPVRDRSKPADGSYTPQQIDVYDQLVAELHSLIDEVDDMNPVTQPTLAPDYDDLTNNDFPVLAGFCCWHDDTLYKAKQNIPTYESWTAAHWEEAVIGEDLAALSSAVAALQALPTDTVLYGTSQALTEAQKTQARGNIGAAGEQDVSDLKSTITNLDETEIDYIVNTSFPSGFRTGYFAANSGASKTTGSYCRTITYLPVNVGDKVRLPKSSTHRYSVVIFSSPTPSYANNISNSEIFVDGHYAEIGEDYVFTAKAGEYYFICCNIPYDNGPTAVPDKPTAISSIGHKFAEIEAAVTALQALPTDTVLYGSAQTLTDAQKTQARSNIGAAGESVAANLQSQIDSVKNQISRIVAFSDWADEIGSLAPSYPLGWRDGFWKDDGTRGSSTSYIMTAQKIRAYVDAGYSQLFKDVSSVKITSLPSNCTITVRGWDATSGELEEKYSELAVGDVLPITQGLTYGITLTGFSGEASSIITSEFISQIVFDLYFDDGLVKVDDTLSKADYAADAKVTGDRIGALETDTESVKDMLPAALFDWNTFNTLKYPTGWRVGSWTDAGAHNTGAGNAIHLIRMLTKTDLQNVKQLEFEWTGNYTGSVKIFLRSAPTTLYKRIDISSGDIVDIDDSLDAYYGITLAGFGTGAQDALDNDYPDNIVITKHMLATAGITKRFKDRNAEYFTVEINSTYPTGDADSAVTANVDCVLMLPENYSPTGEPTRLIFMHHGNSGTVNVANRTWYSESNVWDNFVNAYLNAGYAVFDVNGAGPVSDSNASHDYAAFGALQAAYKAYRYIAKNYNVLERILVHGSSMGGATAYAFAKAYGGIVDAIGLFSPALLSRSALMDSVDDYIAANYGYADVAAMIEDGYSRLIPANPHIEYYQNGARVTKEFVYDWVNNYETVGLDILCKDFNIPVKIWCGTADTSVDPKYGEALAKAITNAGGFAIFRPVSGGTHAAGLGGNSTVNAEAVVWFTRFR